MSDSSDDDMPVQKKRVKKEEDINLSVSSVASRALLWLGTPG